MSFEFKLTVIMRVSYSFSTLSTTEEIYIVKYIVCVGHCIFNLTLYLKAIFGIIETEFREKMSCPRLNIFISMVTC